jgi:alcohol dehydrogenase YqhD (iron-dependent ADH family)
MLWLMSRMIPDLAILDPELTVSVPKNVTADTGIDVFHALYGGFGVDEMRQILPMLVRKKHCV